MCAAHYRRWAICGDPSGPVKQIRPTGLSDAEVFAWFMPGDPPVEGCWDWAGALNSHGYGKVWLNGAEVGAHVLSYRVHHGPTGDLQVMHCCDRRRCVHPAHLTLGTIADNVGDAVAKNRHAKGEAINTAKLTKDDVRAIRSSMMSGKKLAKIYKVSTTTISAIRTGKTWKHV